MTQGKEVGGRKPVPPYVAYKSFKNFLEGLRGHGIPGRIDRSVMGSLSGATQTNILHALRYLGLTAEDGTPTTKLPLLVNAQGTESQKIIGDVIRESYKFLFADGFDLTTATPRSLDERFETIGITGDTIRKCVYFFISLSKDSNVQVSKYVHKIKRQRQIVGTRQKKAQTQTTNNGEKADDQIILHGNEEKPLSGMVRIPISIGINKIWTLTMNQEYTRDDVDRFIQIVQITLGAGGKK